MGKMFTVLRAMDTYTGRTYYHYDGLAGCITHIKAHNGADVRVWKAAEAGYDTEGGPFVTVCHTHGTIHNWRLLRDAIARAPLTEWCEACHEDECNVVRTMVNWTTDSIFTARDHHVRAKDGSLHPVRLYADGWTVGKWEGMDIWSACRVLNDLQAELPTVADVTAQGFFSEGD